MPIWTPPAAADQPDVTLRGWRAFKVKVAAFDAPTVHLAGQLVEGFGARVTSAIESVNARARHVVTSSGRIYRLTEEVGLTGDATFTWQTWLRLHDVEVLSDATDALCEFFSGRATGPLAGVDVTVVDGGVLPSDGTQGPKLVPDALSAPRKPRGSSQRSARRRSTAEGRS